MGVGGENPLGMDWMVRAKKSLEEGEKGVGAKKKIKVLSCVREKKALVVCPIRLAGKF